MTTNWQNEERKYVGEKNELFFNEKSEKVCRKGCCVAGKKVMLNYGGV